MNSGVSLVECGVSESTCRVCLAHVQNQNCSKTAAWHHTDIPGIHFYMFDFDLRFS